MAIPGYPWMSPSCWEYDRPRLSQVVADRAITFTRWGVHQFESGSAYQSFRITVHAARSSGAFVFSEHFGRGFVVVGHGTNRLASDCPRDSYVCRASIHSDRYRAARVAVPVQRSRGPLVTRRTHIR